MRVVIVTGGNSPSKELLDRYLKKDDFVIGVDKGCNCLYENQIEPRVILGDFDSINGAVLDYYINKGITIEKFKPEKDYSDTDLAYRKAVEMGAKEVILFGATGTRVDHMLGNIGIMLKALKDNIHLEIIDDNNRIFLVDRSTSLVGQEGSLISFHAVSEVVKNFTIKKAMYTLENYDMTLFESRAICNVFLKDDIEISFDKGIIMVIYPND